MNYELFGFSPNLGALDLTGVFQCLAVLGGLIWDVVMGRRLLGVVSERVPVIYGQSA